MTTNMSLLYIFKVNYLKLQAISSKVSLVISDQDNLSNLDYVPWPFVKLDDLVMSVIFKI